MKEKEGVMTKIKPNIVITGVLVLIFCGGWLFGRQPAIKNGAEIKIALDKMLKLGSLLYIAAHPDDENTTVLAYMSSERKLRTGYLSLNRGGGGQNLIGSEKGPLLSVLRTNELLKARGIDGAEQFFTRATDFGYSKTSEESMNIWGKEKILEDTVFVIRQFQPDVILTRFTPDRGGHGHHSASAALAREAFDAAADPNRFNDQLEYVKPWKTKRIFWDSWLPYWGRQKPGKEYMEKVLTVDVGKYNHLLGTSYFEIASKSRSMHKTQGFGSVPRRGSFNMYFDQTAGDKAKKDILEGIDTTWSRVKGSSKLAKILTKARDNYDIEKPHAILPLLLDAHVELKALPKSYWTIQKAKELKEIIRSCAGFWLEAIAEKHTVTPGGSVKLKVAAINRSAFPLNLKRFEIPGKTVAVNKALETNKPLSKDIVLNIPADEPFTHPYWLRQKPGKGIYPYSNHRFKGKAIAPPRFVVKAILENNGREVAIDVPVMFRWRDPVEGERLRTLTVMPPVTANFTKNVFYFSGAKPKPRNIELILRSGPEPVKGKLKLKLPKGWSASPAEMDFAIDTPMTEKLVTVAATPPKKDSACYMKVELTVKGKTYNHSQIILEYDHLPMVTLHPPAEARVVRVNVNGKAGANKTKRIGYIMGSGDEIPPYLRQVGYEVDELSDDDLHKKDFSQYHAIIAGVRAYNTRDILKSVQPRLLDYVSKGGRLVVQYNTSFRLKTNGIGPFPFKISRDRVTEEDAVMTLLKPGHPFFQAPNKIVPADFHGWVQERGLYFANEWDKAYTALLSCNDKGEEPKKGSLLVAKHGKGVFVFTGLSFFRQLPAGVPGALKLFVNLLESRG